MATFRRAFWKAFDYLLMMNPFLGLALFIIGIMLVAFGIRFSDRAAKRTSRDTVLVVLGMLMVPAGLLPWAHKVARHLPAFARDIFD